jgi:hypothetical protein
VIAPLVAVAIFGLLCVLSYVGAKAPLTPSPGTIWFGKPYEAASLDMPSYTLQGVASTFPSGQAIGLESALPKDVEGLRLTFHVTFASVDHVVGTSDVTQAGLLDFFDLLPASLFEGFVGPVTVTITDSTGATIATGGFSIVSGTALKGPASISRA